MKKSLMLTVGICLASLSYAQVWQPIDAGTTLKLNSVSFGSELVGYIGANDSTLFKTTDGGENWTVQPTQGIQFTAQLSNITQVDFVSSDTGFAMVGEAIYAGNMYKTVDGGSNWTLEFSSMCSPIAFYNFDSENSFLVGSSCFGGKTIDQKENGVWGSNSVYLSWQNDYLRTITFYDSQYGMAAGDSGTVHRTFDGGQTWDTIHTFTDQIIWDLHFVNDSVILGVVDSLQVSMMISTDSGSTWAPELNSLSFQYPHLKSIIGMKNGGVIAVGSSLQPVTGVVLLGDEDLQSWGTIPTSEVLNSVAAVNDSIAFAVGNNGLVMSNRDIINSVPVLDQDVQIWVYPNPVNSYFTVRAASSTIQKVVLYDVLGRPVLEVLQNFDQIDVSHLAPGLYQMVVEAEGNRKVMSLIVE